jgi:hypothetical protein
VDNETRNGNDEFLYRDVITKNYQNKLVNPKGGGERGFFSFVVEERKL